MSNKNLFAKKTKEPANAKPAISEPEAKPVAKAASVSKPAFSFKAADKSAPAPALPTQEAVTAPATVEDEIASLLGEDVPDEVGGESVDTVGSQEITVPASTEIATAVKPSALEAPAEFAHEDQADGYTRPEFLRIKESLELVKANINDEQIVGDAIYNLMQTIRDNPEFADMLEPEDLGIMVRGLRESYHVVVTVKTEKAAKKGKKALKVDEVSALLDTIGGGFSL